MEDQTTEITFEEFEAMTEKVVGWVDDMMVLVVVAVEEIWDTLKDIVALFPETDWSHEQGESEQDRETLS